LGARRSRAGFAVTPHRLVEVQQLTKGCQMCSHRADRFIVDTD
jgi:hypothetical protein